MLSSEVIAAAIEVHKELGPGLLEGVYEECLMEELRLRGIKAEHQVKVPIVYKGKAIGEPLVLDVLVEDALIVELKAVKELHDVYTAQLLTYLRMTNRRLGLLVNFNVSRLTDGLKRIVNNF